MGLGAGVLDVLNSGVGVVSPLLGGMLMGAVGSGHTPHAGAFLHAALACVLLRILPVREDRDEGGAKAKNE